MDLGDCYRLLGLRTGASFTDVKASYRRLAQQYHPDINPNDQQAKELNKEIKKAVKKDKTAAQMEQLEEIDEQGYKWTGVKNLKAKKTLKYTKFKDKSGNRIPIKQYAEKAAEYLAEEQWKDNEASLPPAKQQPTILTEGKFPVKDTAFTSEN